MLQVTKKSNVRPQISEQFCPACIFITIIILTFARWVLFWPCKNKFHCCFIVCANKCNVVNPWDWLCCYAVQARINSLRERNKIRQERIDNAAAQLLEHRRKQLEVSLPNQYRYAFRFLVCEKDCFACSLDL